MKQVVRRHAHHRRHPLATRSARAPGPASKPRSSTTRAPFHQASSDWTFQPPTWNCGSTCSTTSCGPRAGREVEREVRPEAVRVGEQRALRLAGRAARVDEEQRVVRLRRRAAAPRASGELERRARRRASASAASASARSSSSTRKHRGLGVVELVGDLGRREPPRDRVQDRPRLRAAEEDGDVLGRCSGQRRDAAAAARGTAAISSERRSRSAYVQRRRRVDRDRGRGRRARSRRIRSIVSGAHPRNSSTSAANSSGRSQKSTWPAPSISSSRAPGIRSASSVRVARVDDLVCRCR